MGRMFWQALATTSMTSIDYGLMKLLCMYYRCYLRLPHKRCACRRYQYNNGHLLTLFLWDLTNPRLDMPCPGPHPLIIKWNVSFLIWKHISILNASITTEFAKSSIRSLPPLHSLGRFCYLSTCLLLCCSIYHDNFWQCVVLTFIYMTLSRMTYYVPTELWPVLTSINTFTDYLFLSVSFIEASLFSCFEESKYFRLCMRMDKKN